VGCHQAELIERTDVLSRAAPGATLLLNSPRPAEQVWDSLPRPVQEQFLAKGMTLYAIDASQVARDAGLRGRINTVLQTCFFAISGVLPREEAIAAIKAAIAKTYSRRGPEVVARNNAAVDQALAALSSPADGRLPRAWIARLAGQVKASLAASGGVEDSADVAAYLLAGADVVMTTSALLRHQAEHAMVLLGGLTDWMTRNGFTCLAEARGLLASSGSAAAARDRAGYVRSLRAADRGEPLT
jgi:hypothetical protein